MENVQSIVVEKQKKNYCSQKRLPTIGCCVFNGLLFLYIGLWGFCFIYVWLGVYGKTYLQFKLLWLAHNHISMDFL